MNYYRRYSGDYLRDTARLNMTEHGAYNLLMDYYYSSEEPPPLDREEIYLMVRAVRDQDRAAVDKVLGLYFEERDDGFHQKRIDHEIECAQKARSNGQRGGRAKWRKHNGSDSGLDTVIDSEASSGFDSGLNGRTATPPTTNHHPPTTILQSPEIPLSSGCAPDTFVLDGQSSKKNGHGSIRVQAMDVIAYLNLVTGHAYKPVEATLRLIEARMKEGFSAFRIKQVIQWKNSQWQDDDRMAQYLRPATLFSAINFANYEGETPEAPDG